MEKCSIKLARIRALFQVECGFKLHSMDLHKRKRRRISLRWFKGPSKWIFIIAIYFEITSAFIQPATSIQHSYPALNTPPVLYVPDRNWRISETEQVGQVIARIRAEDAENDELTFGLEPNFHANYANSNEGVGSEMPSDNLPFYIDPVGGEVYLNESLVGRAGENFFLYITVSDGKFTAKNEVFVNILAKNNNKNSGSRAPSIQNMVQNISQFLPPFNQLPGVQFTNQQSGNHPSNNLPPGFSLNPSLFKLQHTAGFPHTFNFNPDRKYPIWPTNKVVESVDGEDDNETKSNSNSYSTTTITTIRTKTPKTTNRIKLAAITTKSDQNRINTSTPNTTTETSVKVGSSQDDDFLLDSPTTYSIKATTIPVLIAICGLFVAVVIVIGYLFRKRLCAISKTLNKKSKEDLVKKSNNSNSSSNNTDDSRNFISMQNWNGPMVYSNRYVPWERDQQLVSQNMISTSIANSTVPVGDAAFTGMVSGTSVGNNVPDSFGVSASTTSILLANAQNKFDQWEFSRHRLKFFNILGEGAFGQVWRCEATDIDGLEGVTTVAVKTLKENATQVEKNDLVSELQVMKTLEPHVNVVRLLGCCTDKDPLFVIIEYVNRGKLQTYLRNSRAERHYGNTHGKSNILTSGDLTSFMYQVAKGMDYLTSRGIIHRDLAARNILITDDHTCKVADFGFARDVISSKIYERKSEGKLPIRWMAIESLYDNIFSVKSDIWSFGILMWEIVTLGSTPYPGISASDVMRKVREGHRLEKPEHCRRELYNIMYYCWAQDRNERPTFAELVQLLEKLLHTEMDYIELERFPDHNYYNILSLSGEKV